jgi:hypothetical protein
MAPEHQPSGNAFPYPTAALNAAAAISVPRKPPPFPPVPDHDILHENSEQTNAREPPSSRFDDGKSLGGGRVIGSVRRA